jgi:hypothetical protein
MGEGSSSIGWRLLANGLTSPQHPPPGSPDAATLTASSAAYAIEADYDSAERRATSRTLTPLRTSRYAPGSEPTSHTA